MMYELVESKTLKCC